MATKYQYSKTIHHACGHNISATFMAHNRREFDQIAHQLSKLDCITCQSQKQAKQKRLEQKIVKHALKWNLPQLLGTVEQVKWARVIRMDLCCSLEGRDDTNELMTVAAMIGSASWWIKHRTLSVDALVELLSSSIPQPRTT